MTNFRQLPNFTNVFARQLNNTLHCQVRSQYDNAVVAETEFDYLEYDCEPSFVAEVSMWATKQGGIENKHTIRSK